MATAGNKPHLEGAGKDEEASEGLTLPPPAARTPSATTKITCCAFCGEEFASRSALFRHLQRQVEGCTAPRLDPGEKVMLLFGYDCCLSRTKEVKHAAAAAGSGSSSSAIVTGGDSAGERILEAMGISGFEERTVGVNGEGAKPVGFSQASSVGSRRCPLLAQEPGVSAT